MFLNISQYHLLHCRPYCGNTTSSFYFSWDLLWICYEKVPSYSWGYRIIHLVGLHITLCLLLYNIWVIDLKMKTLLNRAQHFLLCTLVVVANSVFNVWQVNRWLITLSHLLFMNKNFECEGRKISGVLCTQMLDSCVRETVYISIRYGNKTLKMFKKICNNKQGRFISVSSTLSLWSRFRVNLI